MIRGTMEDRSEVVVIGGGPAGLATGASLRQRGIEPLIIDRGEGIGDSWAARYDRLHLHTPRLQSHLPGYRIPRTMGRWVSRDDMVRYLRAYADHHGLAVKLGVEAKRVERRSPHYLVTTNGGAIEAKSVVVATGYNQEPFIPEWPGTSTFGGDLIHAATFRRGSEYRNRTVLVVGSGNTGAEIAADLADDGASRIWWSVRTPPNVIPRQVGPLPITLLGLPNDLLPPRMTDPLTRLIQKTTIGDFARLGLPAPREGLAAQVRRTDTIPIIDSGVVDRLREGKIEVVAAVVGFESGAVVLADGHRLEPEVVIAATGYRRRLEELVGHLGVLENGRPKGRTVADAPGLYFVGLSNPLKGLLLQINLDARAVARAIAAGK